MRETLLDTFATTYRLRTTKDAYGRNICPGPSESLVAEYGAGRLSVVCMGSSKTWWNRRRETLAALGCRIEQDGDTEGSLSFDPGNAAQCRAVITAVRLKRQRVSPAPSAAQQLARARFAAASRTGSLPTKTREKRPPIDD